MKSHSAESTARTRPSDLDSSFPAGWRVDNFERLAVLQRGFDLPSSARSAGNVPIVGSNGIVGWHSEARVRGPGVVTGRSGSIGESTYVEGEYWPLNTSLYVSNFHDNIPRFVHYFIQWFDLSRFASGVSVPTLNRNSVYGTEVKIPSPREQGRIAAVLWKLQRAIATQDRLIGTTRDLKQSAMHRLFTSGLRGEPLKETKIGAMPESWKLVRLGDPFETQLGKMLSQKARGGDSPKLYLRNKNVQWGQVNLDDVLSMDFEDRELIKFRLSPGDLLVCEGGVIGRAAIWQGELEECYYQKALHRIRPKSITSNNEFLLYWFSFAFEHQNLYNLGGANSTIAHLPEVQLKELGVPMPDSDEQKEIVRVLTTIDRKLAHHQKKRAALNDLFQTLLHKLMTGEIRVADIDIDTSEITAPTGVST